MIIYDWQSVHQITSKLIVHQWLNLWVPGQSTYAHHRRWHVPHQRTEFTGRWADKRYLFHGPPSLMFRMFSRILLRGGGRLSSETYSRILNQQVSQTSKLLVCNAFAKYLSNWIIFPSGGESETTLRLSKTKLTSSSSSSSSSSAIYMLLVTIPKANNQASYSSIIIQHKNRQIHADRSPRSRARHRLLSTYDESWGVVKAGNSPNQNSRKQPLYGNPRCRTNGNVGLTSPKPSNSGT